MQKILQNFYKLGLILSFFTMFVIFIVPGTGAVIYNFLLLIVPLYLICMFFSFSKWNTMLCKISKISFIKYYLLFLLFVLTTTVVHAILGYYVYPYGRYFVHMKDFFIPVIIVYFMPLLGLFLKVKMHDLVKIIYLMIYFVSLVAVLQYFSFVFNIQIFNVILDFFTNFRTKFYNAGYAMEAMRAFSIFGEPSGLGQFIFITLPFVINVDKIKSRLFPNKYIDIFIKKTFLLFSLLALLFTKSPVYLLLCTIELLILAVIKYKHHIKRYFLLMISIMTVLFLVFMLSFVFFEKTIENTFLYRIIVVIHNLTSLEGIVSMEPSLATRLIAYFWQAIAFTHNIMFGCGLNNVETFLNNISVHTIFNMPITEENMKMVLCEREIIGVNRSLVWSSLAEFGLVGFSLYLLYYFESFRIVRKLKAIYYSGFHNIFLNSLQQAMIMIFIISFYNLQMKSVFVGLFLGLVLNYTYIAKYNKWRLL